MTRKFKHKESDWTAILDKYSPTIYKLYNRFNAKKGEIARQIIENSYEWEEITGPEYVIGKWYITQQGDVLRYEWAEGEYLGSRNYTFNDSECAWGDRGSIHKVNIDREATPDEIHETLEAIRKHKGLVEGVRIKDAKDRDFGVIKKPTRYDSYLNILYSNDTKGTRIYHNKLNQWAEKVEEPYVFTEDAGEIYDKDQKIFKATPSRNKGLQIESYYADEDKEAISNDTKFFNILANAELYIEQEEPLYSNEDLNNLGKEIQNAFNNFRKTNDALNHILYSLAYLKSSKNNSHTYKKH